MKSTKDTDNNYKENLSINGLKNECSNPLQKEI